MRRTSPDVGAAAAQTDSRSRWRAATRYAIRAASKLGFQGAQLRAEARLIRAEALGGPAYDWEAAKRRAHDAESARQLVAAGVAPEVVARVRSHYRPVEWTSADQEQLQRDRPPPFEALELTYRGDRLYRVRSGPLRRGDSRGRPRRGGSRACRGRRLVRRARARSPGRRSDDESDHHDLDARSARPPQEAGVMARSRRSGSSGRSRRSRRATSSTGARSCGSSSTSCAPRRFGCACSDCGQTFQWPGLLDRHRLLWHELEEAA